MSDDVHRRHIQRLLQNLNIPLIADGMLRAKAVSLIVITAVGVSPHQPAGQLPVVTVMLDPGPMGYPSCQPCDIHHIMGVLMADHVVGHPFRKGWTVKVPGRKREALIGSPVVHPQKTFGTLELDGQFPALQSGPLVQIAQDAADMFLCPLSRNG